MNKHSLIFVHGMGVGDSNQSFEELSHLIKSNFEAINNLEPGEFYQTFQNVMINYENITYGAKRDIYTSAFPDLGVHDFTPWDVLHPVRPLRYFVTFFLGDVTAYVSENDNKICVSFWREVKRSMREGPYSIIAHSLGSVIAFDFLFKLFEKNELFIPESEEDSQAYEEEHKEFQDNLSNFKNNFRNLFTFGSTIGLFMMRKGELWKDRHSFSNIINPIQKLSDDNISHSWLNFYDTEDILAYPLENLFNRNSSNTDRALKEIKVETGNLVLNSHLNYWKNQEVAREIANTLTEVVTH